LICLVKESTGICGNIFMIKVKELYL
jgi:hypothetical protein